MVAVRDEEQKEQRRLSEAGCRVKAGAQVGTHYQNILLKLKHTRRTSCSKSWQSSLNELLAAHPTSSRQSVSRRQSLFSQGKHNSSPKLSQLSSKMAPSIFHLDSLIKIDISASQSQLSSSILAAALKVLQTGSLGARGEGRAMALRMGSTRGRVRRWQREYALEQREGLQLASSRQRSLRACRSLINK